MKKILVLTAALFHFATLSFPATVTMDSSTFTVISSNFPTSGTSFTDAHGNTMTIDPTYGGGFGAFSFIPGAFIGEPVSGPGFNITFASPVLEAGFDYTVLPGEITGATLSNGESVSSSVTASGFYGVQSSTAFTEVSFDVSEGSLSVVDFRYTPESATPEPATVAVFVPLVLAALATLRLRARRAR